VGSLIKLIDSMGVMEGENVMVETKPSPLSYDAIAGYAEQVAVKNNLHAKGAADLTSLVANLGGKIEASESFFGEESLRVHGRRNFTIVLPALTSSRRDRFTIAHELGHYFVHYLMDEEAAQEGHSEKIFTRGGRDRAETQANVFPASLLMPQEAFKAALARFGNDWDAIARHFEVSPRAAEVRAEVIGRG